MNEQSENEIIGEALREKLSEMAYQQIRDNDISPRVFAKALLDVAGNILCQHLGVKNAGAMFRELADELEEKQSKRLN